MASMRGGWNGVWCAREKRPGFASVTVRRHSLAPTIDNSTKDILTFMSARVQMSLRPFGQTPVNDSCHDKLCTAGPSTQWSLLCSRATDTAIAAAFRRYLATTGCAVDEECGGAQHLDRRAAMSQRRRQASS